MPEEHAAYLAKHDYIANTKKDLSPSTAPRHDDPLSRHRLSYLSGGVVSGKTTRAIELFRQSDPLVFTQAHRLAKEMRTRGRPGPDLQQLLLMEWPDEVEALKDRAEVHSPCDRLGRGLHSAPPHPGNFPRLARGSRRPGHLLWRPGTAAPYCRRDALRLAPRGCTATYQLL